MIFAIWYFFITGLLANLYFAFRLISKRLGK